MAFFGAVVKPGSPSPLVPHPEEYNLHLSAACLPATVPKGKRVSLLVNHEDEEPVVIATLVAGTFDTAALDLFFSEYVEFTLQVGCMRMQMQAHGHHGRCNLLLHEQQPDCRS